MAAKKKAETKKTVAKKKNKAKKKNNKTVEVVVKNGNFLKGSYRWLIIILCCVFMFVAVSSCSENGNKIKLPSGLSNLLPDRPDWLPDWFPTIFEKEGNGNDGGTDSKQEENGESGEEPTECEHRDENDDGLCDKCGEVYSDGEEPCEHRDENKDEYCDICGLHYYCRHIDEDDNGLCDKCGEVYSDGEEPCEHRDENKDEYCDICGLHYYCLHIDEDGDAVCDKCGGEIPQEPNEPDEPSDCTHIDENEDRFCDNCGAILNGGGDGAGDKPSEEPECEHRDEDDDGLCDKCGATFSDGEEPNEPECEHRDEDDDGVCDKCGATFSDGEEPNEPECEHRDEDDDGVCDKCGEAFSDGEEPNEPECEHRDEDGDGLCDNCGESLKANGDDSGTNDSNGNGSGIVEGEVDLMYDEETGAQYYIESEGTYVYSTVDGYIPSQIQGEPVVGIADYFYVHCMENDVYLLEDVYYVIPDTVLYIGDYAFAGAAFSGVEAGQIELRTVVYEGNGMKYVGTCAFAGNTCLQYVNIPCADNCEFGDRIFEGCIKLSKKDVHLGSYEASELAE